MRYFSSLRASTDSYEMSMSVSDFQQFAANCAGLSAAAANSAPVFNGQQQQVTLMFLIFNQLALSKMPT